MSAKILWLSKLHTDVVYFPVYTTDGIAILNKIVENGIRSALISSDGLLNSDYIRKTVNISQGMYLSGPAPVAESQAFTEKYRATYGEDPVASYHLQAYDAALMLFAAIEKSATPSSSTDNTLLIPRKGLRDFIYKVQGVPGLSGTITCSPLGDCAEPKIEIFQIQNGKFAPIYP